MKSTSLLRLLLVFCAIALGGGNAFAGGGISEEQEVAGKKILSWYRKYKKIAPIDQEFSRMREEKGPQCRVCWVDLRGFGYNKIGFYFHGHRIESPNPRTLENSMSSVDLKYGLMRFKQAFPRLDNFSTPFEAFGLSDIDLEVIMTSLNLLAPISIKWNIDFGKLHIFSRGSKTRLSNWHEIHLKNKTFRKALFEALDLASFIRYSPTEQDSVSDKYRSEISKALLSDLSTESERESRTEQYREYTYTRGIKFREKYGNELDFLPIWR